jgi:nucleoside-diphosphate-sugar epimerase
LKRLKASIVAGMTDLILVTGATGHVGRHSVRQLLAAGHRVRVAVRDPGLVTGDVEVVTADLGADDNWDKAVAGVRYVLHHASPFPATAPRTDDEVIRPARDGAVRVLAAARSAGVERVVLTSSYAAVGYTAKPGGHYDESDWTQPRAELSAYVRSKVVAERAAWDFVRAHPGTELTVINPTGIFGPLLGARLSASTGLVKAMLDGAMPVVPRMYFGVVDVRDVADLHLRAMVHPRAAGERFLAAGGAATSFFGLGRILARHLPAYADRVPARELTIEEVRAAAVTDPRLREAAALGGRIPVISAGKAKQVLGWQARDTVTTITETADDLVR